MSAQYKAASTMGHLINQTSIEYDLWVTVKEPDAMAKKAVAQGLTAEQFAADLRKGASRRNLVIGTLKTLADFHDRFIRAIVSGTAPPISDLIQFYCKTRANIPEARLPDGGFCGLTR